VWLGGDDVVMAEEGDAKEKKGIERKHKMKQFELLNL
jgi:hypothetical protein